MTDQTKTFRSRNRQILDLLFEVGDGDGISIPEANDYLKARRHICEAEARGAAQARAEDAKGCVPVGWICVDAPSWMRISSGENAYVPLARDREDTRTMPLYSRPANVAALEARVKELEAALAPECYTTDHSADVAKDVQSLMGSFDSYDVVEFEGVAIVRRVWAFSDDNGQVYEFATEAEAETACAALVATGEAP